MRLPSLALALVLTVLPAARALGAEEAGGAPVGSLTLISQPPGCGVRLVGDQRIEGRAPLTLARGLAGRYRVLGLQEGYETWRRSVVLDGLSADTLWLKLTPKSAARAGLRSAVLPGWGQFYGGHPVRGWVMLGLGLAAGAAAVVGEARYEERLDHYQATRDRYRAAHSVGELEAGYAAYAAAAQSAEDAFNDRRTLLAAGAGVWALNLLDAIVFFERPGEGSWRVGAASRLEGVAPAPALAIERRF